MDQQRFDDLARQLAVGQSRRHVLKLFGGGLAGGIGAIFLHKNSAFAGGPVVCAEVGQPCTIGSAGSVRAFTLTPPCCIDLVCTDGFCAEVCTTEGNGCSVDEDCCEGLFCAGVDPAAGPGLPGVCTVVQTCQEAGNECAADEDCCVDLACLDMVEVDGVTPAGRLGICGTVSICAEEGESCGVQPTGAIGITECCEDLECVDAVCVPICGALGEPCEVSEDCCDDLTCFEAVCDNPKGCIDEGETCSADEDCCGDLVCTDEVCSEEIIDTGGEDDDVDVLPETGIGRDESDDDDDDDRGHGLLMGAVLGVGAAAVFAANKLRGQPATVKSKQ